jgi:hypothetical protein
MADLQDKISNDEIQYDAETKAMTITAVWAGQLLWAQFSSVYL